jgi:hypothetical protein
MNNLLNKLQEANQLSCKISNLNTSKLLDSFNGIESISKYLLSNSKSLNEMLAFSKLLNQRLSVFDTNIRLFEKFTTINNSLPKIEIKNYKDMI